MTRDVAVSHRHEYVGTEHMLLALLAEGTGVGAEMLRSTGVNLQALAQNVERQLKPGRDTSMTRDQLPYSSRAKCAIELAMAEATRHNHPYVGSEHLLMGIVCEGGQAEAVRAAGATEDVLRSELVRILDPSAPPPSEVGRVRSVVDSPPDDRFQSIIIELRHRDGSAQREEFVRISEALLFLARSARTDLEPDAG